MKKYNKKTLLLLNHGLGDVTMTIPLIRDLILADTQNKIHIITKTKLEEDLIKIFINDIENKNVIYYNLGTHFLLVKLIFSRWDNFLAPHSSDSIKTALLTFLINAKYSSGPIGKYDIFYTKKVDNDKKLHKVEYYRTFNYNCYSGPPKSNYKRNRCQNTLTATEYVVVSPGSGDKEKHKRIPEKILKTLIKNIVEVYGLDVVLIGSRAEQELLSNIIIDSQKVKIRIVKSLEDSIELLSSATACVCPCNGTSHIAAALEIPILSIIGPTNSGYTGPYSSKLVVVDSDLPCSPCYSSQFIEGCGDNVCMSSISIEVILSAFNRLLDGKYDTKLKWKNTKIIN
jgi:ADP-heptose:LPS heptosyltransferase